MKILAFDCSTAQGSVAVMDGEALVFRREFACPRGRGGTLFNELEAAIAAGGIPDRIAVGVGPGSYNGLRVAAAAAEGLGIATGAALVGIASVRALPCSATEYVAISDARGGVFYFVQVRQRQIVGDMELLPAGALAERLAGADGLDVIAPMSLPAFPQAIVGTPDAVILAQLAVAEVPTGGSLEPIYLKPPHITPARARS